MQVLLWQEAGEEGGGGGGGGGAIESAEGTLDYTLMPAYTGGSGAATAGGGSTQSVKFSKESHTMWVYLVGGGAGGGGGNGKVDVAPNEENCKALGQKGTDTDGHTDWATYDGFGLCVTKFNQVNGGSYTNGNCFTNYTHSGCSDMGSPTYNYGGCRRAVCNHDGAEAACNHLNELNSLAGASESKKWRLPTKTELLNWNTAVTWKKIMLCDSSSNSVVAKCPIDYTAVYTCNDTAWGTYSPAIWSGTKVGNYFWDTGLYGNTWSMGGGTNSDCFPRSARCVLSETYNRYTGGGGASGTFIKLKVPQNVLTKATEKGDATLKTFAGNGGKGGSAKSTSNGVLGTDSYAEILNFENDVVWRVTVPGAKNAAQGASISAGGKGGNVNAQNSCKYLDITNPKYASEQTINCADLPDVVYNIGESGGDGDTGASYASKGYGARAGWGDGSLQGSRVYPPSGESSDLINGADAAVAGGGGSGGNCYYNKGALSCGNGGNGAGGRIYATHRVSFPGAGGGGGAAGTVAHIKNIQVRPGDYFKIQTGHGGNGGSVGAKGEDGGNSYVELTRGDTKVSKYEILGGGGGNPATKGNPDTNTQAMAGFAGAASKIASGVHIPNNEYFPKKQDETKGSDGVVSADFVSAYGGNGGINSKISNLAITDGTMNGKPCGGLNTGEIKINDTVNWECNSTSIVPLNLSRALNDITISSNDIAEIIQNLAPGATGGGGGGWKSGASPEASGGAKGMGGYVIIYFGDWSGGE